MVCSVKKIIHCDADCFFAAIEERDNPLLRGRPLAVGGNQARGVISTCNYPARRFGVRSAMASQYALRLCPQLIIRPHRMEAYREASLAMRHIFYEYTDLVEPLSLDEAFLDVSQSSRYKGSATLIAEDIRRRIHSEVGITVSAGVAPNKFLAKIASDWRKPDGLFVITPDQVKNFVACLPVKKIFGVGKATAARLAEMGVDSCADLQRYSVFELTQKFGQMGQRLYELSRGCDERSVNPARRRKSLSVEHTYSTDLTGLDECLRQLPGLLAQLEQRLAPLAGDYQVVKLHLKLKFSDFRVTNIERTGSRLELAQFAQLCAQAFARLSLPVRLLGVGVGFVDLEEDKGFHQLALFE